MWFTATKNRIDGMRRLIQCMKACDDVPEVAVMVDHHDGQDAYRAFDWPKHWHIHYAPEPFEWHQSLNVLFSLYPDEPWYGLISDHCRPKTRLWSSILVASARGGYANAETSVYEPQKNTRGHWRMRGGVFDGRLMRAAGFMMPPDFIHLYGDDVWEDTLQPLGLWRQTDVVIDNAKVNRNTMGDRDPLPRHKRVYKGIDIGPHDDAIWKQWQRDGRIEQLQNRIREALK